MIPEARVVKALNTVFARNMSTGRVDGEQLSAFVAGDDDGAKRPASQLLRDIGFEPVDCGSLRNARYLEPMAALIVELGFTMKMGMRIVFKLLRT